MIGLACWKREDVSPHFGFFGDCRPLPTNANHAPVILLASESDMLVYRPTVLGFGKSAFFTRNSTSQLAPVRDGRDISICPNQSCRSVSNENSADARPIFRAAFYNLTRWTRGTHAETPPQPDISRVP